MVDSRLQIFAQPFTFAGGGIGCAGRIHAMAEQPTTPPSASAAEELQRLQCLQTMGITAYHPRFRLPGAKPSTLSALAETEVAAPVVRSTAPAAVAPQERVRDAPVRERGALVVVTRAEVTKTEDAKPVVAKTETLAKAAATNKYQEGTPVQQFQLLFLQVDDDLAILNQIPALARPQLKDKQLALLTNLLRWMGKPVPAHTPRMFRWPLPGLESRAAGMQAETSVLHFLEQASSERGFRFLLLLGPQAMAPASTAWQSFATHSLDEMLALPALKREAWQSLLPLHAALHAGN